MEEEKNQHGRMPLLESLESISRQQRLSFHMPGHTGGAAFCGSVFAQIGAIDTTELPVTDDINNPAGPARQAMEMAAVAFGAGRTFFLTGGSTAGVLSMIATVRAEGRTLLLPRAVHRSVLQALVVTRMPYRFISQQPGPDSVDVLSAFHPPSPTDVAEALAAVSGPCAVFITSPDYYGVCADLAGIASICRQQGARLLVDEAQGAHFIFGGDRMPFSAMEAGADLCVQSAYKTLPALTQAALLHVSGYALSHGVTPEAVSSGIRIFQTSSPSFPIAASIDYARDWMEQNGRSRMDGWLRQRDRFDRDLPAGMISSFSLPSGLRPGRDPLRLVIDTAQSGLAAPDVFRALSAAGIDLEMADLCRLVCIPGLGQDPDSVRCLADALCHIASSEDLRRTDPDVLRALDLRMRQAWLRAPERVIEPWALSFPGSALPVPVRMPVSQSAGQTAMTAMVPYPPGIPLVWPGEKLDDAMVSLIQEITGAGMEMDGLRNTAIPEPVISVLQTVEITEQRMDHV